MSVVCLTACVLLIALWVQSYWRMDGISGPTSHGLGYQVYSTNGWIVCSKGSPAGPTQNNPWEINLACESPLERPEG